jgi:hypothetical protein
MTHRIRIAARIAALVLSFGTGAAIGAGAFTISMPIARSAPPATVCDGSAPLLDQNTGHLSAGLDLDGNFIVAYQDFDHGGIGVVAQHIGDHLVSLPAPPPTLTQIAPAFSPPDSVKIGDVALVLRTTPRRLYFTQRRPSITGATSGPYGIWCLEF